MTKAVRMAICDLPDAPLAAAAAFHGDHVPRLLAQASGADVTTIILPNADHTHRGWRLAAVQSLARAVAPARVNAIAGTDEGAIAEAALWLEQAPGVTGHMLTIADAAS